VGTGFPIRTCATRGSRVVIPGPSVSEEPGIHTHEWCRRFSEPILLDQ
jgi:hypothetical protein